MTTGAWRVAAAASTTLALGLPGVLIAANGVPAPRPAAPALSQPDAATEAAVASMAKAPLSFEPNVGQAEPGTAFVARGLAHSLSLEPDAATLTTGNSAVRMRLVGGDPGARVQGRHQLEGRINYLVGNDPAKWRSDVATYAQVAHEQVWPGIDLVWHEARSDALEYDFVVAPGADPNAIAVRFEGATGLRLDGGDLVVSTDGGELRQHAPVLYQDAGGRRLPVDGRFTLDGDTVRFSAGAYDPSMPLVIDPTLVYSTYLGETSGEARNDHGNDIAVDSAGAAYVTGETCSTGFPVTSLAYQKTKNAACDAFVTKFSPTQGTGVGTGLVYSTYLGSSGGDEGLQIAVDSAKNAYVIGEAATDFPTTPGAYQTSGTLYTSSFLAKLNKGGGKLLYSTYLGDANVRGLALGPALPATPTQPTVYVDGYGGDAATADAFQTTCNLNDSGSCSDIWLARLNAVGGGSSDVVYATYLGGTGGDDPDPSPGGSLVVDGAGRVYLGGNTTSTDFPLAGANGSFDTTKLVPSNCPTPPCAVHPGGFVALIDPSLSADGTGVPSATNQQLVWSTYLEASTYSTDFPGSTAVRGLALGPNGTVYIAGGTSSPNFPSTPGAYDPTFDGQLQDTGTIFFAKLDPALAGDGSGAASASNPQLVYSTSMGNGAETIYDIAVNGAGVAWVVGETKSATFPVKNALDSQCGCFFFSALTDGFVAKFNPAGTGAADLLFSTFMGGTRVDWLTGIALGPDGSAYVTGSSDSYKNSDGHLKVDRYPVVANNFKMNNPGGNGGCSYPGCYDAVVSKISAG